MKGDFVEVVYRHPEGIAVKKVQAVKDGGTISVRMPERGDLFVKVEVLNKALAATETSRFLAGEVLAITEGHETLARAKKKK